MNRFIQLILALAAFGGGLWCLYAGYGRDASLAGKTEKGLAYLKTGIDGRTRVLTAHQLYGAGLLLVLGGSWWMVRGGRSRRRR